MPGSPRAWFAAFAAAGLAAAAIGALGLVACGSFRDASDPVADGDVADAVASADGAVGDAGAGGDGPTGVRPVVDAAACINLSSPPAGQFVAAVDNSGSTAMSAEGLQVDYPPSTTENSAQWNYEVTPGGATGATIAIDAVIEMPSPLSITADGYAGFASFGYGDPSAADTAPAVVVALGALSKTEASLDLDLFPNGLGANATPEQVASFATVGIGTSSVHVVFDVIWSVASANNASAYLGTNGTVTTATGGTLVTGVHVAPWTIALGGSARDNQAMTITYKRLCVQLH